MHKDRFTLRDKLQLNCDAEDDIAPGGYYSASLPRVFSTSLRGRWLTQMVPCSVRLRTHQNRCRVPVYSTQSRLLTLCDL